MADVSKDKLRKEITAILKNADLNKMSAKKVRQQLEEKLDVDLTDQKKVVDDLVMEFLKDKKPSGKKGKKSDSENEDDEGDKEENGGDGGEDEEEDDDDDDDDEEGDKDKRKAQKRSAQKNSKGSDSEEPSDEDDEEEYGAKKKAKTTAKKGGAKKKKKGSDNDSDEDWGKNRKKAGGGGKRGGGGAKSGYTKPCHLSPELAKLVGKDSMPRHEVVKKIWAIIKERDLYDPENKQFAICDNDLLKVIGVKRFRAFSMMKYLKNHFVS